MTHFRGYFFVKATVILSVILIQSRSQATLVTGKLPEISGVLSFLENLLKPYVKTKRSSIDIYSPEFRTKNTEIEKVVKKKVAELKKYLQDDANIESAKTDDNENLTLESKDETTIIEFLPERKLQDKNRLRNNNAVKQDKLKANVDKYKKLRKKIKSALLKEEVSEKTSSLITSTLDKMIATLIENQCTWKNRDKLGNNTHVQSRVDKSIAMAEEWNEHWAMLKKQYEQFEKENPSKQFPGGKIFVFFEQFHEYLSHIAKDLKAMSNEYKIVCQFVPQEKVTSSVTDLRTGNNTIDVKKKHKCLHFKVCTDELTKFMIDFYYSLNDTAVSTLRNYASMYVRDVNTDDSQEKENVVSVLNHISELTEYKISKIFRKETNNFDLDKNKDEAANIKRLKMYIKNNIANTKAYMKDKLDTGLQSLKARLLTVVKQDLNVNLDVDLGNLEKDFKSRICTLFSVCNGQYVGRRYVHHGDRHLKPKDKNSVYVKVQVNLDDELREKLLKSNFLQDGLSKNLMGAFEKSSEKRLNKIHQDDWSNDRIHYEVGSLEYEKLMKKKNKKYGARGIQPRNSRIAKKNLNKHKGKEFQGQRKHLLVNKEIKPFVMPITRTTLKSITTKATVTSSETAMTRINITKPTQTFHLVNGTYAKANHSVLTNAGKI